MDNDIIINEIIAAVDSEEFYLHYLPDLEFSSSGQSKPICCPFHEDDKPSFSIHLTKGFNCFGCGSKGKNVVGFHYIWRTKRLNKKSTFDWSVQSMYSKYIRPIIPERVVRNFHNDLLENIERQRELAERGINFGLIKAHLIGYDDDDERFTVPISDTHGFFCDIRKIKNGTTDKEIVKNLPYDYLTSKEKKERGEKTYGESGRIFPWDNLKNDKLFLCEGEWDTILLDSWGFSSITAGGVNNFHPFADEFKDKEVYIVFDNDKGGCEGAQRLLKKLYPFASKLEIVTLPMAGDITDFYKAGYGEKDFKKLLDTENDKPIETNVPEAKADTLSDIVDLFIPDNYGKSVSIGARITGEDENHYSVPNSYKLKCDIGFGKKCEFCPLARKGGELKAEIDETDNFLLALSTINDDKVIKELKKRHDIVSMCSRVKHIPLEVTSIQQVLLSPSLERKEKTVTKENTKAFNLGKALELNVEYKLDGYISHNPHTQQTSFVILNATPQELLLDNFVAPLKEEVAKLKKKFCPSKLSVKSILKKHRELMGILGHNVTNIYKRSALHSIVDLTFHSPLQINFDGVIRNSYMETVIIGDSNTGKNAVVDSMSKFYKAGLVLDAAACTTVGLIGGMVLKKYFSWGSYVQQHRRILTLDEGSHLTNTIEALRTVREGKADYNKADAKRQTVCMTRLIILANDPTGSISSNPYPIMALPNLFGHAADITRFTTAFFLREEDNPNDLINQKNPPKIKTDIAQDEFRFKLLNAWSLKPDDIIFTAEAIEMVYALAKKMAKKYESSISLVQGSVQWRKIATFSGALAADLYHMNDEGTKLIITKEFVEAAVKLMEENYDSQACEYDMYASQERNNSSIADEKEVMEKVFDPERVIDKKRASLKPTLDLLLSTKTLTHQEIGDAFQSANNSNDYIRVLIRNRCLIRKNNGLEKTKAFTQMLKKLLKEEKE